MEIFYLALHLKTFSQIHMLSTSLSRRGGGIVRIANWKMWGRKHQLKKITDNPSHCIQFLEREWNSKPQECEKSVLTRAYCVKLSNSELQRASKRVEMWSKILGCGVGSLSVASFQLQWTHWEKCRKISVKISVVRMENQIGNHNVGSTVPVG